MLQTGKARRRNRQWHRCRLTHQRGRKRTLVDVNHDSLTQTDRMKCVAVLPESQLIVGASIRILEERPWHAATRKLTQIRDRCDRCSDVRLPIAPGSLRVAL
jgi:hypothetical protein